MINLKYYLSTPRQENSLLIAKGYFEGRRFVLSTKINVPTKYWNQQHQAFSKNAEFLEMKSLRNKLNDFDLKVNAANKYFNANPEEMSIRNYRNKILQPEKSREHINKSFSNYLNNFIEERDRSALYKKESIKIYDTLKLHINNYNKNREIVFGDLNTEFILHFIEYLQLKDYSDNHINKLISTLKTVLNHAAEAGIEVLKDYKSRSIKAPKREADNIYLSIEEIESIYKLENLELEQDQVRDLFVLGCYTGLRYSDFNNLTEANITQLENNKKALRVITYKTNDILWIPMHSVVQEILEKYKYNLPKNISNQKMNVALKVIGKKAGLTSKYLKRTFRGGRAEVIEHSKHDLLTTHCARRSFATNAYKAKVPMLSIMKITGHKKTETFQKYIKISKKEHALLMSENSFFN